MHAGALELVLEEQRAIFLERVVDYVVDVLMLDISRNTLYLLKTVGDVCAGQRRELQIRLVRRKLGHNKVRALHERDRSFIRRLHTDAEEIVLGRHLSVVVEVAVEVLRQTGKDVKRPLSLKNSLIDVDIEVVVLPELEVQKHTERSLIYRRGNIARGKIQMVVERELFSHQRAPPLAREVNVPERAEIGENFLCRERGELVDI